MSSPRLTRDEVRRFDQRAIEEVGLHSLVLMENAGRGCVDVLERLGIAGPVVIACGKGNNGGDGFVMARHLDLRGYAVRVLHWDPPEAFSPDCRANYEVVARLGIPLRHVVGDATAWLQDGPPPDWCVDALLGTGSRGEPRSPYREVIEAMNGLAARRLAVDLPSGLDCDTGQPADVTFRADHTCTLVAEKVGFATPAAQAYLGTVHIVGIGLRAGGRQEAGGGS